MSQPITLITANINFWDHQGEQKCPKIAQILAPYQPDILAIQEANESMVKALSQQFGYECRFTYHGAHRQQITDKDGIGIIVNPARFRIIDTRTMPGIDATNNPNRSLMVIVQDKTTNKVYKFVNTHLKGGMPRAKGYDQLIETLRWARSIGQRNDPIYIMGDLNHNSLDIGQQFDRIGLLRSENFHQLAGGNIIYDHNPRTGYTQIRQVPQPADYIGTNDPTFCQVQSTEILLQKEREIFSDHNAAAVKLCPAEIDSSSESDSEVDSNSDSDDTVQPLQSPQMPIPARITDDTGVITKNYFKVYLVATAMFAAGYLFSRFQNWLNQDKQ